MSPMDSFVIQEMQRAWKLVSVLKESLGDLDSVLYKTGVLTPQIEVLLFLIQLFHLHTIIQSIAFLLLLETMHAQHCAYHFSYHCVDIDRSKPNSLFF